LPAEKARAVSLSSREGFATRLLGRVANVEPLGSLVWLTLEVPGWPEARPGQFALLQAEASRCFLPRPLSIAQEDDGRISFLIAPIGDGTRELSALHEGELVWVLGPLGNGFDLEQLTGGAGRLVVVAGGVGAAPFPLLLSRLAARFAPAAPAGLVRAAAAGATAAAPGAARMASVDRCREVLVLLGFRDTAQAVGARPVITAAAGLVDSEVSFMVQVVSEDGGLGQPEKISETLQREIRRGDRVAACGPWSMTLAISRVCREVEDVETWFSLEAGMACGIGSCHGCVIAPEDGPLVRVCREGPVFSGSALFGPSRVPAVDAGPPGAPER
jgi:dihydroorotate dehydrogenase electron transfer subunit